jgi:hypothetical protein
MKDLNITILIFSLPPWMSEWVERKIKRREFWRRRGY